jgi:hypothetical protein
MILLRMTSERFERPIRPNYISALATISTMIIYNQLYLQHWIIIDDISPSITVGFILHPRIPSSGTYRWCVSVIPFNAHTHTLPSAAVSPLSHDRRPIYVLVSMLKLHVAIPAEIQSSIQYSKHFSYSVHLFPASAELSNFLYACRGSTVYTCVAWGGICAICDNGSSNDAKIDKIDADVNLSENFGTNHLFSHKLYDLSLDIWGRQ